MFKRHLLTALPPQYLYFMLPFLSPPYTRDVSVQKVCLRDCLWACCCLSVSLQNHLTLICCATVTAETQRWDFPSNTGTGIGVLFPHNNNTCISSTMRYHSNQFCILDSEATEAVSNIYVEVYNTCTNTNAINSNFNNTFLTTVILMVVIKSIFLNSYNCLLVTFFFFLATTQLQVLLLPAWLANNNKKPHKTNFLWNADRSLIPSVSAFSGHGIRALNCCQFMCIYEWTLPPCLRAALREETEMKVHCYHHSPTLQQLLQ